MPDTLEGVDPELAAIAQRIIAESGGKITISSGRRSSQEQEVLYRRYKSGKGPLAAKPGTSKHEHGGAIDFGGDMNLLAQLGRKYGLSNSVPGEPWHWTLGGEEGNHTARYSEYDLGDDTSSNPQDVLANRLNSVLRIIGSSTTASSPEYGDATIDQEMVPDPEFSENKGVDMAMGLLTQGSSGKPKSALQKYAAQKLSEQGMGQDDVAALITLWNKESGWDPNAQNPDSTAFGIAQFLNGTWAGTGTKKTSDPYQQIDAGLKYINQRYGSPSKALQFHLQNNWY